LKVFLQGLYDTTNDTMNKCQDYVNSAIVDKFTGTITDLITVELHNAITYATVEYTATAVELHQDGTCNSAGLGYVEIPAAYAGNYYITIKTRNHLETTTASAISFTGRTISYDFTDVATRAYGSNMKLLKSGVYGLYAGDVSKSGTNGAIEPLTDYAAVKAAISNTPTGYQPADINGDGKVEPLTDYATVKAAISLNINAVLP